MLHSNRGGKTGGEGKKTGSEPGFSQNFMEKRRTSCVTAEFSFQHILDVFAKFTLDAVNDEEVANTFTFNLLPPPSSFISREGRPPFC